MRLTKSIDSARAAILASGIQQPSRYKMKWDWMPGVDLYPYAVTLPGYGYDMIDHSIWSIIRKIPFRQTHTEVDVTFIIGNNNYASFVNHWATLIGNPKKGNNSAGELKPTDPKTSSTAPGPNNPTPSFNRAGVLENTTQSRFFADSNQISREETENASGDENAESGSVTVTIDPKAQDGFVGFENQTGIWTNKNVKGKLTGVGGAANYMTAIYPHELTIDLLDEEYGINSRFIFHEAYVSQIAQVGLTSVETGYSPFKVFFRFTTLDII